MLRTQTYGYPKVEKGIINKFYNILANRMVDDGYASGVVPGIVIEPETAQKKFENFIQKNSIARQVKSLILQKVIVTDRLLLSSTKSAKER
jgi:hypothetical protein